MTKNHKMSPFLECHKEASEMVLGCLETGLESFFEWCGHVLNFREGNTKMMIFHFGGSASRQSRAVVFLKVTPRGASEVLMNALLPLDARCAGARGSTSHPAR